MESIVYWDWPGVEVKNWISKVAVLKVMKELSTDTDITSEPVHSSW